MYENQPYFGDPGAMDDLAGQLYRRADEIDSGARGLVQRADSIDFEGPAATEFRVTVDAESAAARELSRRTIEIAHQLRRAAQTARIQIEQWRQAQAAAAEKERP